MASEYKNKTTREYLYDKNYLSKGHKLEKDPNLKKIPEARQGRDAQYVFGVSGEEGSFSNAREQYERETGGSTGFGRPFELNAYGDPTLTGARGRTRSPREEFVRDSKKGIHYQLEEGGDPASGPYRKVDYVREELTPDQRLNPTHYVKPNQSYNKTVLNPHWMDTHVTDTQTGRPIEKLGFKEIRREGKQTNRELVRDPNLNNEYILKQRRAETEPFRKTIGNYHPEKDRRSLPTEGMMYTQELLNKK